jgi:nucleoside-diphosphate-sugar epimerase
MTVAVTGAGGFVGRHIVAALRAAGQDVVALSRRPVERLGRPAFDLCGEVPSAAQLRARGVTALVHCAWDFSPTTLEEARGTNVAASEHLAVAASEAGASLVAISTMSAFPGCRSVYGRSKLEMEQAFLAQGGLVLRPGLVWSANPGGMVGTLDRLARLPVAPVIAGAGKLYAVHADDLAALVVRAVQARPAPQVLTAAHPRPFSLREILTLRAPGRAPLLLPVPWPLVWLGVRAVQAVMPNGGLRADSVLSLVHANPDPVFSHLSGVLEPGDLRPFCATVHGSKGRDISQ